MERDREEREREKEREREGEREKTSSYAAVWKYDTSWGSLKYDNGLT